MRIANRVVAVTWLAATWAFMGAVTGCSGGSGPSGGAAAGLMPAKPRTAVYDVSHGLTVKDVPQDARKVCIWFWVPTDDEAQRTVSFRIDKAPQAVQIVREPNTGSRFLYAEVDAPAGKEIEIATHFVVERDEVSFKLDPAMAGVLTDGDRLRFADELRTDLPHMQSTDRIRKLADDVCGGETNVVRQMRKIYDYVVANSDHYSKEGAPKSSGQGSADYCLDSKGGGCTDQHALVIAMARAKGIPTRLAFGSRLQEKNIGKSVDPGYRCWVQYYVPNYGWVPMDASAGDTVKDSQDFYFSGLDANRVRFAEGRNLRIGDAAATSPVNVLVGAYVEVDGKPHTAVERRMVFEPTKAGSTAGR